jgi:hypothetical protein
MADRNMTKPLGIIKSLMIHIHGIPYIAKFTILKNSVVDFSYFMLLGRPWFRDVKVTHDWGNNVIIVQGNGIFRTISANRKLGAKSKRPQLLAYYDLMERLTYEEEDLIFETKLELFSIGKIMLSKEMISFLSVRVSKIRSIEESDPEQGTLDQIVAKVVLSTMKSKDFYVKLEVSMEDKVYPKTYYHHN